MKGSLTRTLYVLAVSTVFLGACATAGSAEKTAPQAKAKAPSWMGELETAYPEADYLAAVGSGDTRRDAESDAMAALARQFTVKVKVDSVAQQKYAELVKDDKTYTESERRISQSVGTQASEQFVNLKFSDPYVDASGSTHIVAYLERKPTANLYRTLIQKDLDKVESFQSRAGGDVGAIQRFAYLDAAYQISLNADRMIAQLRIIHSPSAALVEDDQRTRKVAEERDQAAGALAYRMNISGDEDGKISGIVKTVLSSLSLSNRETGALAVTGSWKVEPVTVNPSYKSVRWTINLSLQDEKGTAIATVFKESRENGIGETEARALAYREVEKRLNKDLPQAIQDYLTRVATKQ